MTTAVDLTAHDVDRERGFLPHSDPLERLPEPFAAWDALGAALPKLLMTDTLRAQIERLAPLDPAALRDPAAVRRAMVILSFLGHAYVWGQTGIVDSIPACLARPWHQVAHRLGRPPVLSYASYALDNWRRLDPGRPIELGNIALLQNFLGGQDEEWFVLVHVAIEMRAGPVLAAATGAQEAVARDDAAAVLEHLGALAAGLVAMHEILARMPERCDPYVYFRRVRPYLHGWADHPSLPEGVRYEGVAEYAGRPQKFRGETGAQSSIIPTLDAALGVVHADDPLRRYLMEMLDYMPPAHRAFVRAVAQGPALRDYVRRLAGTHPELRDAYNAAIDGVDRFRSTHLDYARRYIISQARSEARNPNDVGTGGTPFGRYLKKHRDETSRHRLP